MLNETKEVRLNVLPVDKYYEQDLENMEAIETKYMKTPEQYFKFLKVARELVNLQSKEVTEWIVINLFRRGLEPETLKKEVPAYIA